MLISPEILVKLPVQNICIDNCNYHIDHVSK